MEGSHLLCGNGPVLSTGVGGLLPPTPYPTSHPPNPTPLTSLPPPPLILLFGCSCRMGGRQGEVDGCKVKENLNLQIVTNTNYVILEGSVWSSYLDRYNVSTGKNTTATWSSRFVAKYVFCHWQFAPNVLEEIWVTTHKTTHDALIPLGSCFQMTPSS